MNACAFISLDIIDFVEFYERLSNSISKHNAFNIHKSNKFQI